MVRSLSLVSLLVCIAFSANAHEFWIDPEAHQTEVDSDIVASLRVGELYEGSSYAYLPPRFRRFDYAFGGEIVPVPGRVGDRPAVTLAAPDDGLVTLIHVTTDSTITWEDFTDFESFVVHKDAEWTLDAHRERGLPEANVTEIYSRYAKSLVAVGTGGGSDVVAGLLTEIVALENPYTDDVSDGIAVRLLYEGNVRADEQIEVFEKASDGTVTVSLVRTDGSGVANVPVKPGHRYMLDAVVLRDGGEAAQWESLWANLTFAVPDA